MDGYLNINSLGNKINYLCKLFLQCLNDIVCTGETKIDSSFPNAQFHIDGYWILPFQIWKQTGLRENCFCKGGYHC